jgi:hypothetical protein
MSSHYLHRLALLCLAVCSLANGCGADLPSAAAGGAKADLVVHEWGTFTSVAGRDGAALSWRPLSFESDLPSFVYSIDQGATWRARPLRYPSKSGMYVTVRMETPVLYFYAEKETAVSVKVGFPGGKITEWYPQARSSGREIDWGQFQVLPGAQVGLAHDQRENHYYPARDTDAALVRVGGDQKTEHEKFLFYRGVGNFALPLSVRLEGGRVAVRNAHAGGVSKVILFERRGGRAGYVVRVSPRDEESVERPALAGGVESLRGEMKAMLVSHGLYEREAEAMLNTWRDSWFEEGLRVFYVLPRQAADAILPVEIDPRPREFARVLVGRAELITPEMEGDVAGQLARLDETSTDVRDAALKEINKYGRFTETVLGQVSAHASDERTRQRAERLLKEMRQGGSR